MTINPYTLNSLYNQGIIECVPYDLCMGTPATPSGVAETMGMASMPQQMGSVKQAALNGENISLSTNQTINGLQYLDNAMKGEMYGYYGNSNDTFVRSSNVYNSENSSLSKTLSRADGGTGSQYNMAGAMYGINNGVGAGVDYERMYYDDDGKEVRESVREAASKAKEGVMNSNPWVKGLLSAGIVLGTVAGVVMMIKGKKKP